MRTIISAVLLAGTIISPAAARDRSFYAGIEGGVWDISKLSGQDPDGGPKLTGTFNSGYDVDVVGGYDWGIVRTEAEIGYKRAGFDTVDGTIFGGSGSASGYAKAWTATANVLLDFEIRPGFHLYGGPGLGYGWFKLHPKVQKVGGGSSKLDDETNSGLFGQLIVGARMAVTPNLDFGLKARHIQSQKLNYDSGFYGNLEGKFRASSLLVSLIYNFGSAPVAVPPPEPVVVPPPAPEPAPPPATQTCADGTVILASDACPPPPPPPPAAAEPERG